MTAEISESLTRYPFHDAKLIYIPKPIAEDIVICPEPEVATNELFRTEWVLLFASSHNKRSENFSNRPGIYEKFYSASKP